VAPLSFGTARSSRTDRGAVRLKIGFFVSGDNQALRDAEGLIESAQRVMPQVGIYHLTDGNTPDIGVKQIQMHGDMPLVSRRAAIYAALLGDWCLVDTDVRFQKDVTQVFDQDFDIAVTERSPESVNSDYAKVTPYNWGVVFSRQPKFWGALLPALNQLPEKLKEWDGGQFVMSYAITRNLTGYKTMVLPASYNWTPQTPEEDVSTHHIVHYKGRQRKAWLRAA
jgi:hypothetical protein